MIIGAIDHEALHDAEGSVLGPMCFITTLVDVSVLAEKAITRSRRCTSWPMLMMYQLSLLMGILNERKLHEIKNS